ncbi:MAG: oligosaccharide flippase family protein, partial [Acutalibacteraceae bacterium]|nr:oligosaccharide flippase family protein [Acutalibacteraceae bacterium]
MGKYKKLSLNLIIMTIGQFSTKVLSFLFVPLYTFVLSPDEFGTFDLISTTKTLLTPFLTLVIFEAVLRFCLEDKQNAPEILSIGIYINILGTFFLTIAYPLVSFVKPELSEYFIWVIVFFFISNIHTVLDSYLRGTNSVKFYTLCGVLSTVFAISFNLLFLLVFKWKLEGYMLSYILSSLIVSIIIVLKCHIPKFLISPFKINKSTLFSMLKFSCPMIPNSVSWWVCNSLGKYMVLFFINTAAVGIFSVSYKIPSIISIVLNIFISAWQISAFENFSSEKSQSFFRNIYLVLSSLANVLVAAIILFSKFVAYILYQKEFFSAWKFSSILVFAFLFHSLSAFLGTVYTAAKKTKMLFLSTLLSAGVNILFNLLLIPLFGIAGAAFSALLSYFSVWLFRLLNTASIMKLNIQWKKDSLSYLLIFVQIAVSIIDKNFSFPVSAVI